MAAIKLAEREIREWQRFLAMVKLKLKEENDARNKSKP
jgi:hypothetical protein